MVTPLLLVLEVLPDPGRVCRTERDSVVTVGENTTNIFIPVERRETTGNM